MNPDSHRIAFFGGSFDPVHCGHLKIAKALVRTFELDKFIFLPAFHAPHKPDSRPTSGYHRFAMLALATAGEPKVSVSTLELDHAKSRYTFDTLNELKGLYPNDRIFFVMGGDSWGDIKTWHRWEEVMMLTDHIVVTRPGYEVLFDHVTAKVRSRVVDARGKETLSLISPDPRIYITDAVNHDVSATEIRNDIGEDDVLDRTDDVPVEVAKYIEKYELYR